MKILTLEEIFELLGIPEHTTEFWKERLEQKYGDRYSELNTLYAREEIHEREDRVPELDIHIPFIPNEKKKPKRVVPYNDNPHDLDYAYWH